MLVDEAEGSIDTRPRTQELSSSLKVIPYIDHAFQEWHGFPAELDSFLTVGGFDLCQFEANPRGNYLEIAKFLLQDQDVASRLPVTLDFDTEDCDHLLVLFISVCHLPCTTTGIARLMRNIAEYRWSELEGPIVGLLFCCLRAALHKTFGPSPVSYSVSPTPAEYEAFRQNVVMRYPGADVPISNLPPTAHAAFSTPKRLSEPLLGVPTTPKSIEEACEIFRKRVEESPAFVQFWQQHELLARSKAGATPEIRKVDTLYAATLPFLKSFFTVFVNYLLKAGVSFKSIGGIRASLGAAFSLIMNCSHVLEQQYMLTLLFDLQYHLVVFKISAFNQVLDIVLQSAPQPIWSPNHPAQAPEKRTRHTRAASTTDGVRIEQFNVPALESLVLMMRILRLAITDRNQRIAVTADLPASPLKQLMSMYNDDLWTEVLLIFKFQASLNGKKWRCMNMEIISAIYIHCPFKLDDDWLNGGDSVSEVRAPAVSEEVLREIMELYNSTVVHEPSPPASGNGTT